MVVLFKLILSLLIITTTNEDIVVVEAFSTTTSAKTTIPSSLTISTNTNRRRIMKPTTRTRFSLFFSSLQSKEQRQQEEDVQKTTAIMNNSDDNTNNVFDRRMFVNTFVTTAVSSMMIVNNINDDVVANAYSYEKSYPQDVYFDNDDTTRDKEYIRKEKINQMQSFKKKSLEYESSSNLFNFRNPKDFISSFVWGSALWLLAGSRSNPLITPLANILYDVNDDENNNDSTSGSDSDDGNNDNTNKNNGSDNDNDVNPNQWLKDRNEGLFAAVPAPLLILSGVIFFFIGIITDRFVLFIAEGDTNICLQLAGVSLIGGGALELGRIASGEKQFTRSEIDRDLQLQEEFIEFANKRLLVGNKSYNCHRSEVVKAFRRYYAKYRDPDNTGDNGGVNDLEIEKLLRNYNKNVIGNINDMSSAGFFTGIKINDQADVFR